MKINVYLLLFLAVTVGWVCDSILLITGMAEPTVIEQVLIGSTFVVTLGALLFKVNGDKNKENN